MTWDDVSPTHACFTPSTFVATDLSLRPGDPRSTSATCVNIFPDIDSAVIDMKRHGIDSIVLMGHSTGGLTASST